MDSGKVDFKGANSDRPRRRILALFIILIIGAIAAIFAFAPHPFGVPWIFILVFLVVSGLLPVLYILLKYLLYYEREKAAVVPPPEVPSEAESLVANGMFIKLFGNKIIVMVVAPILMGMLVDIFTRYFVSPEFVKVVAFKIWLVGFKFLAVPMVAYIVAARLYQLSSGIFLYMFTDSYAKRYALYRKEVGIRRAMVLAVFIIDPLFIFGLGWFFMTGIYILISKSIF